MTTTRNNGRYGSSRQHSSTPERSSLLRDDRPPSYSSVWDPEPTPIVSSRPRECCECARHESSTRKFVCFITAIVILVLPTIFLLPSIITAVKGSPGKSERPAPVVPSPPTTNPPPVAPSVAPPPPPPPEPPYRRAGLSGDDVPLPGSVYIISEANSSMALTYDGAEGVSMRGYQKGLMAQRWGCHESDGWLGFTIETGHNTLFLGYSPWPYPATLRCSARTLQYSEMFMVSKLPEHGFRLNMKDGTALKPVGRDRSGALAMVGTSDVWWRFTKV
ncbi:hypothetical protein TWF718_001043 [Orbilia javanica]|uniref:Uncharacterized protein n=1 Tax=Orbilia javanica TaxID=47235 RepID=A0AAN8RS47_9PEZI